ncbi:MAG TPA: sigma-70 family RNA polymerase sigma factor [Devosia sp.]|nr:sigma-70 family RNA polymerase sigma factor [Devosia sp.]
MDEQDFLASTFEASRSHLRGVAYRMLGSASEADDAVQEAWLRLSRTDASAIDNLTGWLTTVVARICLDNLRRTKARREDGFGTEPPPPVANRPDPANPETDAALADSVGLALLIVLETLDPAERLAFVLHDMFDLSFDEIAPIVERSPAAARQLASRARRRVRGNAPSPKLDLASQRPIVDAFLTASRNGDLQGLLAVLDPDVVFHVDRNVLPPTLQLENHGADTVARYFRGNAQAARPAMVGDGIGAIVAPGGRLRVVLAFNFANGRITTIDAIGDPARLAALTFAALDP